MMEERSKLPMPHAVVFALLTVVFGLLSLLMARMATTASYAAMAVLMLASLVSLFVAGSRLHTMPGHGRR